MGIVERADRMRERMDGAERFLKRGRAHGGGRHHVRARFEVFPVSDRGVQIFLHQPNPFDGLDGRADIVLVASGAGEDQRVDDDVFRRDAVLRRKQGRL